MAQNPGQHYFKGGTFAEQNAQMGPINELLTSGKYRDIPPGLVGQYFSGAKSLEETVAAITGTPIFDPSKGPQIDFGKGPQPLRNFRENDLAGEGYDLSKNYGGGPALPTKDEIQKILARGSDPANAWTPEKSKASGIISSVTAPIPPGGGTPPAATRPVAGAPVYSSKQGISAYDLPYGDIGARPTPPDPNLQEQLYAQHGIPALQSQADAIDQQIAAIIAQESEALQKILGTPGVSTRYMSAEVKQARAGVSMELASLRAQRTELTKQISFQNKAISMIMSATNKSYSEASREWTYEYSQNQEFINSMDKTSTADIKTAKTMVQSFLNLIPAGQELTADQKNSLDSYVMQAYGPEFAGIESAGLQGILYSHAVAGADGKKYLMTLTGNPDGTYSIKYTTSARTTTGAITTTQKTQMINTTDAYFQSIVDPTTGFINYPDYQNYKNYFMSHGGDGTVFDAKFRHFLSPADLKRI